jgi:hypothetical protein
MAPRGVSLEMHLANKTEMKASLHWLVLVKSPRPCPPEWILSQRCFSKEHHVRQRRRKGKVFRGTASYAHREIFQKYPSASWYSVQVYDKTSLAFSMAVLSTGGKGLWNYRVPFLTRKRSSYCWPQRHAEPP